jgi:hypothetical protein
MRRRVRRAAVRATRVTFVALAFALVVTGGCSNCPTCPKHTEPVHITAPESSH